MALNRSEAETDGIPFETDEEFRNAGLFHDS